MAVKINRVFIIIGLIVLCESQVVSGRESVDNCDVSILNHQTGSHINGMSGLWRNFIINWTTSIELRDSVELDWIPINEHYPRTPYYYMRIQFPQEPNRGDWVLGWGNGGIAPMDEKYDQFAPVWDEDGDPIDEELRHQGFYYDAEKIMLGNSFKYWKINLYRTNVSGDLFLPENTDLRITIFFDFVQFESPNDTLNGESRLHFTKGVGHGYQNHDSTWTSASNYFNRLPLRQQATLNTRIDRAAPVAGEFTSKLVLENGASGNDWLPDSGSVIGVVAKFTNAATLNQIAYSVNYISTWQGSCMNFPAYVNRPEARGLTVYLTSSSSTRTDTTSVFATSIGFRGNSFRS